MTKDWDTYEADIKRLYVTEGWTAEAVTAYIQEQYDEYICVRSLRQKIRQWGIKWGVVQANSGRPPQSKKAVRDAAARAAASVPPNNPPNRPASSIINPNCTANVPPHNPPNWAASSSLNPYYTANVNPNRPPNFPANNLPNFEYTANVQLIPTADNPYTAYGPYGPPRNTANGPFTFPGMGERASTYGDLFPNPVTHMQNGTFYSQQDLEDIADGKAKGFC